jgi:CrcB protein
MGYRYPGSGEDDVHPPAPPDGSRPLAGQGTAFLAVAVGGSIGSVARYGMTLVLPNLGDGFPTATFVTNVVGCLLIGLLLVVLAGLPRAPGWLRPLLATGVLGGFTTFSTYTVGSQTLLTDGRVGLALVYLGGTLVAAFAATWAGVALARALPFTREAPA